MIIIERETLDPLDLVAQVELRVQEESLVPMVLLAPLVPLWVESFYLAFNIVLLHKNTTLNFDD